MTGCGYGAILSDADPPPERRDLERAGALGALARDARGKARLRLVGVRGPGNPVGAESVLTWQSGFPGAISFASGAPRYGPGEWSGEAVLARGEVDAVLVVGAEPSRYLSARALQNLKQLPSVFVGAHDAHDAHDTPDTPGYARASIGLATAPLAASGGHVFRMDGVALRQGQPSHEAAGAAGQKSQAGADLPTEAVVLTQLADAIGARLDRSVNLTGEGS
jgi:formylmethanofuran dehydrogenase subunit B